VRTRIAAEPEVSWSRSGLVSAFNRSFEPMIAVAFVGILAAVVVPRVVRNDEVRRPALFARVPTPAAAPTPEAARRVPVGPVQSTRAIPVRPALTQPSADSAQTNSVNTVPLQLGPVLFAEDERRFFAAFVAAVEQGQVPKKAIESEFSPPPDVALAAIEPLVITPLRPLARVAQEGEGQWE